MIPAMDESMLSSVVRDVLRRVCPIDVSAQRLRDKTAGISLQNN